MELIYLGTAAAEGIPGMFCQCSFCQTARKIGGKECRFRSGALIDGELMIDFSPDINIAAQKSQIDLSKVKNIIFTHSHHDHLNANDLKNRGEGYCYFDGQNYEKLHTYGNRTVQNVITTALKGNFDRYAVDFTYINSFMPTQIGSYTVTALPAIHGSEDSYIYLIEKSEKRMLYAHDTGIMTDEVFSFLKGKRCDLISLDCTMGYQTTEKGHMGFPANIKVKQRLLKNGTADEKTVFVCHHFSHNGLRSPDGELTYDKFSEMIAPHGFVMSYDGMRIEI